MVIGTVCPLMNGKARSQFKAFSKDLSALNPPNGELFGI